jgi:hypothetical protein
MTTPKIYNLSRKSRRAGRVPDTIIVRVDDLRFATIAGAYRDTTLSMVATAGYSESDRRVAQAEIERRERMEAES